MAIVGSYILTRLMRNQADLDPIYGVTSDRRRIK